MNPIDKQTIGLAARIYERSGFPSLIAAILIAGLMYGVYFVLRYEVFYTRGLVEAMSVSIETMHGQHDNMLSKQEASLELQIKQLNVQCAQCLNDAGNTEEVRRCNCSISQ